MDNNILYRKFHIRDASIPIPTKNWCIPIIEIDYLLNVTSTDQILTLQVYDVKISMDTFN